MDSSTNINWFPGHMTKAKRQMQESIKKVDMVIECRDARVPFSSKNPMLDEIIGNKKRLIVLTKKDKADDALTEQWIRVLKNENTEVLAIDLIHQQNGPQIEAACKRIMQSWIDKQIQKGIRPRAIRVMVVGTPNVGKSTLINQLAKKKIANVANKPGVTRSLQWIKLNPELELLDTPGVLWPRFDDPQTGKVLAITGAINDRILDLNEIAYYAMQRLTEDYPDFVAQHYDIELSEDAWDNVLLIGKKKGFMMSGGRIDEKRTVDFFIKEIREDKLGKITWETPLHQ